MFFRYVCERWVQFCSHKGRKGFGWHEAPIRMICYFLWVSGGLGGKFAFKREKCPAQTDTCTTRQTIGKLDHFVKFEEGLVMPEEGQSFTMEFGTGSFGWFLVN